MASSMASEGASGGSAEERDQISGDLALALSLQTNTGDEDENGESDKAAAIRADILKKLGGKAIVQVA
ncbi:hypothetical protein B484DRAFT_390114, partial [Ochromonadaceae sp. CCMP2298]